MNLHYRTSIPLLSVKLHYVNNLSVVSEPNQSVAVIVTSNHTGMMCFKEDGNCSKFRLFLPTEYFAVHG